MNIFFRNNINDIIVDQIPMTNYILGSSIVQYIATNTLSKIGLNKFLIFLIISFI